LCGADEAILYGFDKEVCSMKRFEKAEMEIIRFEAADIITASSFDNYACTGEGCSNFQDGVSPNTDDDFECG
jgi:hypothetical protein